MLAKALAVIGCHDDERRTVKRAQTIEERSERAVDERNLAVVGLCAVLALIVVRRLVWRVGIEDMDPGEESALLFANPVDRTGHDDVRATFGHRHGADAFHLRHLIVVDVEPWREAEALRQRKAADEGAGRKAERP